MADAIRAAFRGLFAIGPRFAKDEIPVARGPDTLGRAPNPNPDQLSGGNPVYPLGLGARRGRIPVGTRDRGWVPIDTTTLIDQLVVAEGAVLTASETFQAGLGLAYPGALRPKLNGFCLYFGGNVTAANQYLGWHYQANIGIATTADANPSRMGLPCDCALYRVVIIHAASTSHRFSIRKNGSVVGNVTSTSNANGGTPFDRIHVHDFSDSPLDFALGDTVEIQYISGGATGNTRAVLFFGPPTGDPTRKMGVVIPFGGLGVASANRFYLCCGDINSTPVTGGSPVPTRALGIAPFAGRATAVGFTSDTARVDFRVVNDTDATTEAFEVTADSGAYELGSPLAFDAGDRVAVELQGAVDVDAAFAVYIEPDDPADTGLLMFYGGDNSGAFPLAVVYRTAWPADQAPVSDTLAAGNLVMPGFTCPPGAPGLSPAADPDGGRIAVVWSLNDAASAHVIHLRVGRMVRRMSLAHLAANTLGLIARPGDLVSIYPENDPGDAHIMLVVQ